MGGQAQEALLSVGSGDYTVESGKCLNKIKKVFHFSRKVSGKQERSSPRFSPIFGRISVWNHC